MKRSIKLSLSVLLALMLILPTSHVALAEETVCRGSLGAVVVDNLRVPNYATCRLNGTRVRGTISVGIGASLIAYSIRVIGNIQTGGARVVNVANSTVGGSIQIKQSGAARIYRVRVTGDILFDSNKRPLSALYNNVGGNVQAFQNRGGVIISYNTINGNLQCKENLPRPTGRGNVVLGSKEDQCVRF